MTRRIGIVLLTTLALTGCAARTSRELTESASAAIDTTSESPFHGLLPPRTRELDLSDVDPCTDLLTHDQLVELDYDLGFARPPIPDHSDIHGGPDCTYSSNGGAGGSSRNIRALVGISTTESASAWLDDPARTPDARPDVVTVEGFSALVLPHPKISDDCLVVVDTAAGQYLEVASSPDSGEAPNAGPYCEEAKRVAGMAIQTVLAARPSKFANLLPPRPRELDLTGVDPCANLLTTAQLRDLAYDLGYARPPAPGHDTIHGGPTCAFASNGGSGGLNRNVDTLITISTSEGALAWVTDPRRRPGDRPDVVEVEGFHALVLPNPLIPDECLTVVDTAEGQYLDVTSGASDGKGANVEPYCIEAEHVAGMAIRTVSQ